MIYEVFFINDDKHKKHLGTYTNKSMALNQANNKSYLGTIIVEQATEFERIIIMEIKKD